MVKKNSLDSRYVNGLANNIGSCNSIFIYLFTCKHNSPEANFKVSTSKKNETPTKHKPNTKQGSLYSGINKNNNDDNNSNECEDIREFEM
jgi:hypothetical protein